MDSTLIRIKRAVLAGHYRFTAKALEELDNDGLSKQDVAESIVTAASITKIIRSSSPYRKVRREMLYIIVSSTLSGMQLYTKGKLEKDAQEYVFYILISSKRAL